PSQRLDFAHHRARNIADAPRRTCRSRKAAEPCDSTWRFQLPCLFGPGRVEASSESSVRRSQKHSRKDSVLQLEGKSVGGRFSYSGIIGKCTGRRIGCKEEHRTRFGNRSKFEIRPLSKSRYRNRRKRSCAGGCNYQVVR